MTAAGHAPKPPRMLRGWRWLLASALLNTMIALALTLGHKGYGIGLHALGVNLVYSQCIGLSIWAYIEVAIHFFVGNWLVHVRRLLLIES